MKAVVHEPAVHNGLVDTGSAVYVFLLGHVVARAVSLLLRLL